MKFEVRSSIKYLLSNPTSSLCITLFVLQGCAHKSQKQKEVVETIQTHIDAEDTKKFNYNLSLKAERDGDRRERGKGGGRDGEGPRGHEGRDDKRRGSKDDSAEKEERLRRVADAQLEALLKDMAYCREGYNVVDEYFKERSVAILGECIEKASEEDKLNFKNTRPEPVVLEEDLSVFGRSE